MKRIDNDCSKLYELLEKCLKNNNSSCFDFIIILHKCK